MLLKVPFEFRASYPRRLARSTQRSSDRLTCLGNKYTLLEVPSTDVVTSDASSLVPSPASTAKADPRSIRINVILAHANAFAKELYEPFIEILLRKHAAITAVFIHDVATQGASGLKNAASLGDLYSWSDSGLDILAMITQLRASQLMDDCPLVGIGHSMGATQIAFASLMHSGLFSSTILIEPILPDLSRDVAGGLTIAIMSARRRDIWASREEARAAFLKSPFYKTWHPEVFERWIEYGITSTGNGTEVKLTTTPAQEVHSFLHMMPFRDTIETDPDTSTYTRRHLHTLPHPVHLIFGDNSTSLTPTMREELSALPTFGTSITLKDATHLIPMESPELIANLSAEYIGQALNRLQRVAEEDRSLVRSHTLSIQYVDELKRILEREKTKLKAKI